MQPTIINNSQHFAYILEDEDVHAKVIVEKDYTGSYDAFRIEISKTRIYRTPTGETQIIFDGSLHQVEDFPFTLEAVCGWISDPELIHSYMNALLDSLHDAECIADYPEEFVGELWDVCHRFRSRGLCN